MMSVKSPFFCLFFFYTHVQDATNAAADLDTGEKQTVVVDHRATVFWVASVGMRERLVAMLVGRINDAWAEPRQ
jgi:hypothetical protein